MSIVKKYIEKYGKENLRFLIKMRPIHNVFGLISYTSSIDEPVTVMAKIVEKKYKIDDNYKIELQAEDSRFGKDDYYFIELDSLIDRGCIRVFVELPDVEIGDLVNPESVELTEGYKWKVVGFSSKDDNPKSRIKLEHPISKDIIEIENHHYNFMKG